MLWLLRTWCAKFFAVNLLLLYFLGFTQDITYAYVDGTEYSGTVTVDNTANAQTFTDYQVTFNLDTQTLISAGRMQSDCDDFRVLDADDTTELSYWIESGCNTSSTKVWVKVPSIAASASKTLHLYFGNVAATSEASGTNTFIFFDSFDSAINTGVWTASGTSTVTDGSAVITTGNLRTNATVASQTGTVTEARMAWQNFIGSTFAGLHIADKTDVQSSNTTGAKLSYLMSSGSTTLVGSAADGTTTSYNLRASALLYEPPYPPNINLVIVGGTYYVMGTAVTGSNILYFKNYAQSGDSAGTWTAPYYLWFGHFRGSNAGTTDATDVLVDWARVRKYSTTTPTLSVVAGVEPSAPLNLSAVAGNQKAILNWTVPASPSSLTDYQIEYSANGGAYQTFADGTSTSTTATVTGLTNGTTYTFRVSAINGIGTSTASNTASAIPTTNILHGILLSGQSHSVGYSGGPALSTTQPFYNLKLDTGFSYTVPLIESTNVSGDAYSGAVESPASALANTITNLVSGNAFQSIVFNNAVPGLAYTDLKKGTTPYSDGITYITTGNSIAASLNRTFQVDAVANIHGPADRTRAEFYEDYLNEWQSDYETDIKTVTGQAGNIPMFIDQSSNFTAYSESTSDLVIAQLAAAENNSDIYMVGPKYQFEYLADYLHLENTSYRLLGEYYAKAIKRVVVDGESVTALTPAEYVRNGAEITVRFNVPVAPLAFDTVNILAKANQGFEFYDDSGATPSISGVELVGQDAVKITLSGIPTGATQQIRYAYTGTPGAEPGAQSAGSARGNLRDSDTTEGYSGTTLYNWGVHFSKDVVLDQTAPTQSAISATATNTTASVEWTTSEATSDVFHYGTSTAYGTTQSLNTYPRALSHTASLTGLTGCTRYHYKLVSTDLAGNVTTSGDGSFTTAGCSNMSAATTQSSSNTTPQAVCAADKPVGKPDLFQVDRSPTQATLYFAPPNKPYSSFVVYYGPANNQEQFAASFSQESSSGAIKYQINNLNPQVSYVFKVRAAYSCYSGDWSNSVVSGKVNAGTSSYFKKGAAQAYLKTAAAISSVLPRKSEPPTDAPSIVTTPKPAATSEPAPVQVQEQPKQTVIQRILRFFGW